MRSGSAAGKSKYHMTMRHRHVFLAKHNASYAARRKQRFFFRHAEFFFHHHAGRDGRQRRAQALAVAVGLVVAAAGRGFRNGVWIQSMNAEIGRDHAGADHGPRFEPRLPPNRERIPCFGALLRQHLVDVVAGVHHSPGIVEGIALVLAELRYVRALRCGRGGCSLIQHFGIDGKMRCAPGVRGWCGIGGFRQRLRMSRQRATQARSIPQADRPNENVDRKKTQGSRQLGL